ncbi:MAG: hypothetical protein LBS80_02955 [Tannerella sp.]|jgi:hypothetical protein|nr:hypothetical protein [Tannerella sp.]
MKLTSKIIIGFLLTIFIATIVLIVGFSFTDRVIYKSVSNYVNHTFSKDEMSAIDVNSYRTIVIQEEEYEQQTTQATYKQARYDLRTAGLFLKKPSSAADENKLFISDEIRQLLDIKSMNDTLTITLKTSEIAKLNQDTAKPNSENDRILILINFCFRLHTSHIDVVNSLMNFPVDIKGIETDSIKLISPHSEVRIDSCSFDVYPPSYVQDLKITNSRIREVTIDFDMAQGSWSIADNCQVDIEIFTGSSNSNIIMGHEARKEINWIPKNKDAKLNIVFQGDAAKFKFLP